MHTATPQAAPGAPASPGLLIDSRGMIPLRYLPHFEYCVVDENNYPRDFLMSVRNTVAALFRTGIGEEHTMLVETIRKHDKKVFAEGRQEGRQEGEAAGRQAGEEAGRQAGLKLAALRLKESGHSSAEIARLLGMSLDEVP